MDISTSTALVTGANRGLGRQIAIALLDRGAKVYAAARDTSTVDLPGAIPIQLDITDPASVAAAAEAAGDVTVLVNNAGTGTTAGLVEGDLADIRLQMETHYFGTLGVSRAFAPIIEGNGGGAIANVLSVVSWYHGTLPAYSAAKAAEWALTNVLRLELAPRKIVVTGLHVGYIDTDLVAGLDAPKHAPADVADALVAGIEAGEFEVVYDDISRQVRQGLAAPLSALYPQLV